MAKYTKIFSQIKKNYNEEIFDDNDNIKDSDSILKCLFNSIKTQNENEMILSQNININN